MKHILASLIFIAAAVASADCPNLIGSYHCEDGIFGSGNLEISQREKDGIQIYGLNGDESLIANGKVNLEEWSVPQAAGGLLLTQVTCEENALVMRGGLNLGFMEEKRLSKDDTGALIQEAISLSLEEREAEIELFGEIEKAVEEATESISDRDESLKVVKKIVGERASENWKAAKASRFAQSSRVECQQVR